MNGIAETLNLFELAKENTLRLKQQIEALRREMEGARMARLDEYLEFVHKHGRISINMRQTGLGAFLSAGKHMNIYEIAESESAHTREPVEQILQRFLKKYYERRMAYDARFSSSKSFRYGALNTGCVGASSYGDFCVVIKSLFAENNKELAYLKCDSLNQYMLPGPTLNEAALRLDVSTHPTCNLLAAIKHKDVLLDAKIIEWPTMLCNNTSYIEATFIHELTLTDLESVRVSTEDYKRILSFLFEAARGRLSDAEKIVAAGYAEVLAFLKKNGIKLEVVNA